MRLSEKNQTLLRGAVIGQINADCPNCTTGIDMKRTKLGIPFTAHVLIANCQQVETIISSTTGYRPGSVASYEDLWRITLANYHAGSGELTFAIYKTWMKTRELGWAEIASRLPSNERDVINYINDITK
jgi:hypothetical protein